MDNNFSSTDFLDWLKLDIESKKEDSNFKKTAICSVKINIKSTEENKKRVFKYNYKET